MDKVKLKYFQYYFFRQFIDKDKKNIHVQHTHTRTHFIMIHCLPLQLSNDHLSKQT